MLKNETYIGNMVQGKSVKISYKSQKCIKQEQSKWIVVENTHEPLVDKETFHKVRQLLNSRKYTRSRKYDFLLKGLIFCHECGYPLAVINRKTTNRRGQTILCLPHLSAIYKSRGLYLPLHKGTGCYRRSD